MNNISWLTIIAFIFLAIAIVLVKLFRKNKTILTDYQYQKKTLFTPAERSFLGVLNQVVGENTKIFSKVRIADVVTPKKGLSRSDRQRALNKIISKHFDFILCNNDDLSVLCAIELNDKSHQADDRKQRDKLVTKVCDSAGLPLIEIKAKQSYVINDIKKLLHPHLI
jgi:hypothetical protein